MTEPPVEASVLPLSVTCAPDGRFAPALRAVVGRVGAAAGEAGRESFVGAMQQVVTWAMAQAETASGDLALEFARDGDALHGDLRWQATTSATLTPPPGIPGVEVTCDVDGAAVHCRVSCRCA